MKYNVGDEFLVKVSISSRADEWDTRLPYRINIGEDSRNWVSEEDLEAAAYAAKAAPAPVSTAWEPKPGERVLVEASYSCDDEYGNSVVEIPYSHNGKDGMFPARPVMRSAIVGPAPVRARFAVGDVVVLEHDMDMWKVVETCVSPGDNPFDYLLARGSLRQYCKEANLLTLDEARERLAK